MKATKASVLKELASWNIQLLTYAMTSDNCNTLNDLVARILRNYPYACDIQHLKSDYEYSMNH